MSLRNPCKRFCTPSLAPALACSGSTGPSTADQKIAFGSDRDGNPEIYVMNADGSGVTRLTNNPATDFQLAWSPDGTKIAFRTDRDGNWEIYVMNADGRWENRRVSNRSKA